MYITIYTYIYIYIDILYVYHFFYMHVYMCQYTFACAVEECAALVLRHFAERLHRRR